MKKLSLFTFVVLLLSVTSSFALTPTTATGQQILIPYALTDTGWWSGLAIHNTFDSTMTFSFGAYKEDGTWVSGDTFDVAPHAMKVQMLESFFSNTPPTGRMSLLIRCATDLAPTFQATLFVGNDAGGFGFQNYTSSSTSYPLVNLQITEDEDLAALEAFVAELDARNIKATLIVNDFIATEGCTQLRGYEQSGHEIMVYGRAEESGGQTPELETLTYEKQYAIINSSKSAIQGCLGHAVKGFRSYHFSQNTNTWNALENLGILYNLSYVANFSCAVPGHEDDYWPYWVEAYGFWAVPMHSKVYGSTKAFCDMPFKSLPSQEWESLMKSELDSVVERGIPLKVEFHPYFSANDSGRWDAYVHFLDYAKDQGAVFINISQMVERIQSLE